MRAFLPQLGASGCDEFPAAQRAGLAEAREGFEDVFDAVGLGALEGLRERRGVGGGGEGRERGADGEGLFREGFRPLGRRMRDEG